MTPTRLILASSSPRRRELLADAGYLFDVIAPGDDAECGICSETGPTQLVAESALRKAADVREQLGESGSHPSATIIAADTVAECQGQILGKPRNQVHAEAMLRALSGRRHRVLSGVCVWPSRQVDGNTAQSPPLPLVRVDETTLQMDELTDGALQGYLDSGLWEGKAGAFGYQDRLGWVRIVEGSESNVVGLPMELLREMLALAGYE